MEKKIVLSQRIVVRYVLCNYVGNLDWLIIFIFSGGSRDARVMWDQKTGRSRGFGFVSFRNQQVVLES